MKIVRGLFWNVILSTRLSLTAGTILKLDDLYQSLAHTLGGQTPLPVLVRSGFSRRGVSYCKKCISCTWRAPKRTLCWMAVQEASWEPLGALIGPLPAPSWGSRLAPIGSKTPQDGPRTALGRLLGVPDGPTLAPRRPRAAPGRTKTAPRHPPATQ